jgi:Tol biopolymer transport system component
MTLASGTRLGPYEIVAPLGAGGMGEVYRAKDTRLGREVAIKVLPAEVDADAERLRRFEHEARAASALSHPNILTLFDVGRHEATSFLVTELLEGESLRDRLAQGAPPLRKAIEIGVEIARGLAAAHAKGIVHRDLKPENLFVTKDGVVKILDFGLAKLTLPESGGLAEATTIAGATATGVVMGTAGYMAPEQVRGERADARSDLFSLGCVLYELAAGRRAFGGHSPPETLSAILRDEPEPMAAPGATGSVLEGIVRRCLEKRPEERFQSARDLGFALESLLGAPSGAATTPLRRRGALRRQLSPGRVLLATLLIAALPTAYWLSARRDPPSTQPLVRFEFPPPAELWFLANTVEHLPIAVSPDGRQLGFVATDGRAPQIWLRRIDELAARPLVGTDGARTMTWSPDGDALAFVADGRLMRLDLAGGTAVPICNVGLGVGYALSWGATGDILFASVQGDAIYRVPAAGGEPRKVVESDYAKEIYRVVWPRFLPDGRGFLYTARSGGKRASLMLVDGDQPPREVTPLASRVEFVAPDWLLFAREGALLAQRFDARAARLVGNAVSVAPSVRYFYSSAWSGFAASQNGTIFYFTGKNIRQLAWFDRTGRRLADVGPPGDYLGFRFAPDRRSVLASRTQPALGTYDIWRLDLERGVETRLTDSPDADFDGLLSSDGGSLIYSTIKTRAPILIRRDFGTGSEEELLPGATFQTGEDISPDGSRLAFLERGDAGKFRARMLSLGGERRAVDLLPATVGVSDLRFSPDGRYLAYISDATGSNEAYVAPVDSPANGVRLSPDGAFLLRWSPDGRELLFLDGKSALISVPVRLTPQLELGRPTPLFTLPKVLSWADFDFALDGQQILAVVVEQGSSSQPASVVVGWRPVAAP